MQEVTTVAATGAATGAASSVLSYAVDNLTPKELENPETADAVVHMATDAALGAGIGAAVGVMSPEDVYAAAMGAGGGRELEGGQRGEVMEVEYVAYCQVPEEEEDEEERVGPGGGERGREEGFKGRRRAAGVRRALTTSATDKLRHYAQVGLNKTAQTAGVAVGVGHAAVEAFPGLLTQVIDRTVNTAGTAAGTAVGVGTASINYTLNYAKRAAGTAFGYALLPVNIGINMSYNVINKGTHMALNVTESGLNVAEKVARGAAERVAWVVGAVVGTTERLGTEVFNGEAFQKGYTGVGPTDALIAGGGTTTPSTTRATVPPHAAGTDPKVPEKGVRVVKAAKISPELTAARAAYEKGKASDAIGAVAGKMHRPYEGDQYAGGANRAI